MLINVSELSSNQVYHTITQTLIPRPIAWVLTENSTGGDFNLAPFSYFTAVSSDPALLMLSVGMKDDHTPKDTRVNIKSNSHFVVHIPHAEQAECVTQSAASLEYGDSEIERQEIELSEFGDFPLPRLTSCKVAFGCELYESLQLGGAPQELIFGKITHVYISDDVAYQEGQRLTVDAASIDPLARLGGSEYWVNGAAIKIRRPA
ncbi:Uncharacterised protein [BD1-7 clade bacterium]|uniref:Flavin reductase like domain-containing protein n=1 Tax=BD1-7 clade bacterium TaxID=2029982 RepID=A0A5S9QKZ9_9GAMM|nr:Uncharacterised protein [BD1-7 clade bacterium]